MTLNQHSANIHSLAHDPSQPGDQSKLDERTRLTRVLIVEDQALQRELLLDILQHEGLQAIGCATAGEALEFVKRGDVGVAVIDLKLPDLSGTELLEQLRLQHENIRVIIFTGQGSYDSAKEAVNLGAFAYVEKGGDPARLLKQIHRAMLSNIDRYAIELEKVISERNKAQEALQQAHDELETNVQERTRELVQTNKTLEAEISRRRRIEDVLQQAYFKQGTQKAELARQNESLVQALGEVVYDYFVLEDNIRWSGNTFKMLGYSPEALGKGVESWLNKIHPDDYQKVRERFIHAKTERRMFNLDYRIKRRNNTYLWISDRGVPHFNEAGELVRVIGIIRDSSLQKEAEEALQRTNSELEAKVIGRTSQLSEINSELVREIAERKQVEATLRNREQQLIQALEYQESISEDLHDGVLQSLYAIGLGLEAAKGFISEDQNRAQTSVDQAISHLNSVMRDVRHFITGLNSEVLQSEDIQTSLHTMVSKLSRTHPMEIHLAIEKEAVSRLTRQDVMHLTYFVQEAFSNSLRHGGAQNGGVKLNRKGSAVNLEVWDDGVGFGVEDDTGQGHGLKNMSSRAKKIGGEFSIHSEQGQGTRILLNLNR